MSERDPRVHADLAALVRLRYRAQGFSLLPRQPVRSILAGRYGSRLRGRGLNFEEVRSYLPGDDIRNMDWKVTARLRKPHVRVYTEERDRPVFAVIDQRGSMFFGSRWKTNSVVAAEMAALAGWRALSVGDRVGGIVFGDNEVEEIRPHRSESAVMQLLGAAVDMSGRLSAEQKISGDSKVLNAVLRRTLQAAGHDALIVIASTLHGADAGSIELIQRMAIHNDVLVAMIHDPLQFEMPDKGKMVVSDGALQVELDTADGAVRKGLGEYFKGRAADTKKELQKAEIPTLLISNAEDVVDQVRRQLGVAMEVA